MALFNIKTFKFIFKLNVRNNRGENILFILQPEKFSQVAAPVNVKPVWRVGRGRAGDGW